MKIRSSKIKMQEVQILTNTRVQNSKNGFSPFLNLKTGYVPKVPVVMPKTK